MKKDKQTNTVDTIEVIKKEFSQTQLYKQGGSCWECCEYEDMVDDMWNFIETKLKQVREESVREFGEYFEGTKFDMADVDQFLKSLQTKEQE